MKCYDIYAFLNVFFIYKYFLAHCKIQMAQMCCSHWIDSTLTSDSRMQHITFIKVLSCTSIATHRSGQQSSHGWRELKIFRKLCGWSCLEWPSVNRLSFSNKRATLLSEWLMGARLLSIAESLQQTRMHTHTHTHARTHTHTRTHARTHTHTQGLC